MRLFLMSDEIASLTIAEIYDCYFAKAKKWSESQRNFVVGLELCMIFQYPSHVFFELVSEEDYVEGYSKPYGYPLEHILDIKF